MRLIKTVLIIISLSVGLFATDLTIEVKKKVDSLPEIALEDSSYDQTMKKRFFKALYADLNVLSLFNVDKHKYQNDFDASDVVVQNKDKEFVLRYQVTQNDLGKLLVSVKLFHNHQIDFMKNYKASPKAYIFISHAIAYDINRYMGEKDIDWIKKKIVFSKITGKKRSRIVIADYTMTYQHPVIKGGFNIFPKWANKEQSAIYFTSLNGKKPVLKYLDLKKAKIKSIANSDGMIVCSDVSEDGSKLLITMAPHAQPDIFLYNTQTRRFHKLTRYRGIDVGGQFVGDNKVVFISDRLGYPNVFLKTIGSSSVEQLVYYGRTNSSCNAHEDYIVYQSRESSNVFSKNTFNLHLVSLKSNKVRRLTATGVNEFPRFSDDGETILFVKKYKRQSSIGLIRLAYNKSYLFPIHGGEIQSLDW